MKVKELITCSDESFSGLTENKLGGMGGWFNGHMIHKPKESIVNHTWQDYLDTLEDDQTRDYAEAFKAYILNNNIKECAPWHQSIGVPLFEDDTYSTFSYRAWGDIMAAIYTSEENPIHYMEYYM
mgnify:FL=1